MRVKQSFKLRYAPGRAFTEEEALRNILARGSFPSAQRGEVIDYKEPMAELEG
jgi:hypothetical protein